MRPIYCIKISFKLCLVFFFTLLFQFKEQKYSLHWPIILSTSQVKRKYTYFKNKFLPCCCHTNISHIRQRFYSPASQRSSATALRFVLLLALSCVLGHTCLLLLLCRWFWVTLPCSDFVFLRPHLRFTCAAVECDLEVLFLSYRSC